QQLSTPRGPAGGRAIERFIRASGSSSILNPMATILRSQDSLQLNSVQADSIASMNRRYTYRADSLWAPVARELSTLAEDFNEGAAYSRYMRARRAQLEMLIEIAPIVHDLLTPAQRRKLPARVVN